MKIILFGKKFLLIIALVLAGLILASFWASRTVSGPSKSLPIYCVDRDDTAISLTFDCAWNDDDIDDIITVLDKYNCVSTFFVVGDWAEKYPESVKKLSEAGHEISNHSYNHAHYTSLSKEKMKYDMDKCDKIIEELTGKKNNLFRAPYGDYNSDVVNACIETGRFCMQWDVDSLDWKDLTAKDISNRVILKTKAGSIILMHNGTPNTHSALQLILPELAKKGFKFVPVSQLVLKENYAIDHTGKQYSTTQKAE
ncbi:MAG: polysaccharide deacetylase family protein [Firmicutes bacterium]|nr:polysaccharide deacetylase family protein [Bacillota bacterium]